MSSRPLFQEPKPESLSFDENRRCQHCGVDAMHDTYLVGHTRRFSDTSTLFAVSHVIPQSFFEIYSMTCVSCREQTIFGRRFPYAPDVVPDDDSPSSYNAHGVPIDQLYPPIVVGEDPNQSMPEAVKALYEEARLVGGQSPRAAATLLRVALETLLKGPPYELSGGLYQMVEQASRRPELTQLWSDLEVVRIAGNEAAHNVTLDLAADAELVDDLFGVLNEMVEASIAVPERRKARFKRVPESKQRNLES